MDTGFKDIVKQIIARYGLEIVNDRSKCKALLADYAKGKYKPESRLFLLALEIDCPTKIAQAPELNLVKGMLSSKLQRDYFIAPQAADAVISFLGDILNKNKPSSPAVPPPQPSQAAPLPSTAPNTGGTSNFVLIQGGTFLMGSPASEPNRRDNELQHKVTVGSFYISKYQVTQKEYQEIMGTNPSEFKGDNLPVEGVSWYDVIEYCNARSRKERLVPAYSIINGKNVVWDRKADGYCLPTEAEWEYACRAGTTTPFSTGNNITTDQANYNGNFPYNNNAEGIRRGKTTPVGSFAPNPWGLYDMHGNVWEWCWDRYGTYPAGAQTAPQGAVSGADRVSRGGSWSSLGQYLRSANRNYYTPSDRYSNLGFRLVRPGN